MTNTSGDSPKPQLSGRKLARVTLKDVAEAAGVSTMTVSNVIHDRVPVSPALREKVQEKVRELGYVPHRAAQELAGVSRIQFGLLYTGVTNPFIASVIVGTMNAAAPLNIDVSVQLARLDDPKGLKEAIRRMEDSGVEGFLLPSPIAEFVSETFQKDKLRVPAIGIATGVTLQGMVAVRADENAATTELVNRLLAAGHRRIGHIRGPEMQSGTKVRHQAYLDALRDHGVTPEPDWVVQSSFDFHEGETAALNLLRCSPRVTAVFASNDTLAAGVIAAAHQLGIAVPSELSVVGYDDSPIAEQVWPALTTVKQDASAMTMRAVEVLHGIVQSRRRDTGAPNTDEILFPYQIIERDTIAPAPNS